MSDPSPRIKVIHVIARMNVGGPARLIDSVMRLSDSDEFESLLVTGDVGPDEIDFLEATRVDYLVRRIVGLGRAVRPLDDVRALIALVRLFRSERPDVVHTHTAKAGVVGRIAAVVTRVPVRVHTYHGHVLHGYFRPSLSRAVVMLERMLARRSTALVTVGEKVRDDLLAAGVGRINQYCVVPPGVHIRSDIDGSTARQRLGLPSSARVVLFVGRLTRIKRPDRLVEAFRRARRSIPEAHLVIVGDGELAELVAADTNDLGGAVTMLGWRSDVPEIYPAADVVVITSDNEGMPVTLIEAAMLGIPCVTTDVGSASEVVIDGATGFVVPTSADDVARALVRILSDRRLADRFAHASREFATDHFGELRMVERHASLYRRERAI